VTAEIAILNTYGVSLAADSAVTLTIAGSEKKIYNSANKVFTLSKYHPVGIMIYSNAKFMDIEWEVIIKEYRKILGNKAFDTLFEYADSFLKYLMNLEYISEEQKNLYFLRLVKNSITKIKNSFLSEVKTQIENKGKIEDDNINKILKYVLERISEIQKDIEDNPSFCLNKELFEKKKEIIYEAIKTAFEKIEILEENKVEIINIIISDIKKSKSYPGFSGIVISGYGERELFPSIFNCNIYGVVDSCLIRSKEDRNIISLKQKALIMPFAQSEMVSSFMEGIDPIFEQVISKQIEVLFSKIKDIVKEGFEDKAKELQEAFQSTINEFKRKAYVDPILSIVESLQKSDLAEMAEALVNLTSFKRHVSTEAETVGGPTDVAIITKGDGFIWIKRKHYFDPKLNTHFFENYFREGEGNEQRI